MKLRKIELCGFKSFIDRTVVSIGDELTAVVGPNGCGKSNIVDAIRWAMGEQSARSLRGKAMDDVIFSGSESRGPLSMAEVTLTFQNEDGRCHPDYADYPEVAVTRRIVREGTSEYLVNGAVCRLRDVSDLLLAAGVSPRSSLVEQGRMGMIVTARPEDRRMLIEEAAGIAKYRVHRKAATRKMEQVRQNLLRVSDVVGEMERNLGSLKRQVAKAKRYTAYRDELTGLELHVAAHRYLELSCTARRKTAELADLEARLATSDVELATHEAAIAAGRAEQADAERLLGELQAASYERDGEVQQTEGLLARLADELVAECARERQASDRLGELGIRLEERRSEAARCEAARAEMQEKAAVLEQELERRGLRLAEVRRERLALEERMEAARREVTRSASAVAAGEPALEAIDQREREARERSTEVRQAAAECERRSAEIDREIEALGRHVGDLRRRARDLGATREEREAALAGLRLQAEEAEAALAVASREAGECGSRLQSLEEIAARYENYGQGVRELMGREAVRGSALGVVAELLDVPGRIEPALAAVLGARLQDLVVGDVRSAADLARMITAEGLGRAGTVPASPRRVGRSAPPPRGEGILGPLADLIGCRREHEPLVRGLLDGVVLVETLDLAVRAWAAIGGDHTFVSLAGEVVQPDGSISAGRDEVGLALLETKREIRRLRGKAERLEAEHSQRAEVVAGLRAAISELRGAIETLRRDSHEGDLAVVSHQNDLRRAEDSLARQRADGERLAKAAARVAEALEGCASERARVRSEIEAAVEAKARAELAISSQQEALDERRRLEDDAAGAVTEARVEAAACRERLDALSATSRRMAAELDDLSARVAQHGSDHLQAAESQGRIAGRSFAARERLEPLVAEAVDVRRRLDDARAALDAVRTRMAEAEALLRAARQTYDLHREAAEGTRLGLHEARLALASLEERVTDTRGIELSDVLGDYHLLPPADEGQIERIDELRRLIERMGPVSLTSVEEHDELAVRFEKLSEQKEDLEQSLAHLQRAIQRLNREGRRRFRETFELVDQHFQTVFPRLFEGGRAKLVLTDESDLLETGVDIVAQPPGKKLGRMELMSGGEKALTAVALTFALFQASPSPFCVLDEVDAPFDDANVRRFLELLREMTEYSQFILVTHSKQSMARSDVLYGVTMEEPGVSKLVSVRFREGDEMRLAAAAA